MVIVQTGPDYEHIDRDKIRLTIDSFSHVVVRSSSAPTSFELVRVREKVQLIAINKLIN